MSNFTLETSKREDLQEYLKNKETEKKYLIYSHSPDKPCLISSKENEFKKHNYFKSPNTEEAIEYLPNDSWIVKFSDWTYEVHCGLSNAIDWKTPIEALESMYIYLLENKLI